jgi:hypothetical protein
MNRTSINSSNIAEVGYDPATGTLEVLFHNGRLYQYFDVPTAIVEDLLRAASPGHYFNLNIRGVYRYARA